MKEDKANKSQAAPQSAPHSWRGRARHLVARVQVAGKWLTVLAAVLAVGGIGLPALYSWAKHHPYFALSDVSVKGHGRISRDEILDWAGVRFGISTWEISPVTVQHRLEQQPWIQRAQVRVELPNRLIVSIHERKPMALARLDTLYYVDRRGHLLGPLGDEDSRDFPIITGLDDEQGWSRAGLVLPRVAQLIRWCERRHCFDMISEVRVEQQLSMTVFPMQPPVAVIFGWGSWKTKIERLKRVWANYAGHENRLETVDLSFPGSAVVRLKQEISPPPTPGRKTRV